ncbi:MAG TPA: AAA family ATPase [Holophagaceae bacterium]|nr:AAA family ATPase [Geothrix sp.]HJW34607.1 AAA family ATPase [Holophagaceae bacterium]
MDPIQNPFSPGAGTPPPELAGRDALLRQAEVALGRIRIGRPAKSMILVGLRGVGKTVLLYRIRSQAEAAGYRALMIEAPEDKALVDLLVPPLRQLLLSMDGMADLSQKVKRGLRVLKSFISTAKLKYGELELSIEPEVGSADSGDLESDLGTLLVAVGEAAADRETAIALCIDEIQYLSQKELSALIMAVHQVTQRNLPLVVVAAGLPQILALAGRSKSYSERLFDFPRIGALAEPDAREALTAPVTNQGVAFTEEAVVEIIRVTQGYPYFLQQWGYEAWNTAEKSPITRDDVSKASAQAIRNLDESFFRVRFDRLTPREKDYMRALASLGAEPQRSGDIADLLQIPISSAASLRNNLIRKGMIYSPAHGDTTFTVPLFDQFMLRAMPGWTPKSK